MCPQVTLATVATHPAQPLYYEGLDSVHFHNTLKAFILLNITFTTLQFW